MNLEERVHRLAKKYQIRPRREQGQNFVIDEDVLKAMVKAADLTERDTVVEIGPGFGTLTMLLAEAAGRVVAIEQDRDLIRAVEALVPGYPNVRPVLGDVRTVNLAAELDTAGSRDYKLVSNLPYQITSWVMRHFLEHDPRPSEAVLLIQREVAQRITAEPGSMSLLSVAVQLFSSPEIVANVPATAFWPEPNVESAIIRMRDIQDPSDINPQALLRVAKIGFSAKRKKLKGNLRTGLPLETAVIEKAFGAAGLAENVRAQELTLSQWKALTSNLNQP